MYRIGPIQKKIIIILLGGVTLGMSNNPRQYFRTFRVLRKDWRKCDRQSLTRSIQRLSSEKLIQEKQMPDGSFKMILTEKGKKQAKRLNLVGSVINMKNQKKWDGKWRIVLFDIPESDRAFRDVLRNHLKELKFLKLQQSVFVSPHPYEKQVAELVYLYCAERHVRIITATKIDNENNLKRYFFSKKK